MAMTALEKLKLECRSCTEGFEEKPITLPDSDYSVDGRGLRAKMCVIDEVLSKEGFYELKTGGYESPIAALVQQVRYNIVTHVEDNIVQEVRNCGFAVNKEELKKALAYDRDQYNKGFEDGRAWVDAKIYSAYKALQDGYTDEAVGYLGELLDNHKEAETDGD